MNKYIPQVVGPVVSLCLTGWVGQTTEAYSYSLEAEEPKIRMLKAWFHSGTQFLS